MCEWKRERARAVSLATRDCRSCSPAFALALYFVGPNFGLMMGLVKRTDTSTHRRLIFLEERVYAIMGERGNSIKIYIVATFGIEIRVGNFKRYLVFWDEMCL